MGKPNEARKRQLIDASSRPIVVTQGSPGVGETPLLGDFGEKLATTLVAGERGGAEALHLMVYQRLTALGLSIWRTSFSLETLHPVRSGFQQILEDGELVTRAANRSVVESDRYLKSPIFVLDKTWETFRWQAGDAANDMALLIEFEEKGGSDYVLIPLPFQDTTRTAAISFATRTPGGYTDKELTLLHRAAAMIAPYAERIVLREVAVNLLDTYVGRHSGERILSGDIDRGRATSITAAILVGDLRNFSEFANVTTASSVLARLNSWFDRVGAAIEAEAGEILKFMGDGVLAIFPVSSDASDACQRALRAARAIDFKMRADKGQSMGYGLGLHVGEVAYGNVGSRLRLDFTVIGSAVNLASRLESTTKNLDTTIATSREFRDASGFDLPLSGRCKLKGFAAPREVFNGKQS